MGDSLSNGTWSTIAGRLLMASIKIFIKFPLCFSSARWLSDYNEMHETSEVSTESVDCDQLKALLLPITSYDHWPANGGRPNGRRKSVPSANMWRQIPYGGWSRCTNHGFATTFSTHKLKWTATWHSGEIYFCVVDPSCADRRINNGPINLKIICIW